MFDPNKTLAIIKGGLFEPAATWKSYLDEAHDWKDTLALIAGPLIVVSILATTLLTLIFGSHGPFVQRTGVFDMLLGVVAAALGLLVAAFIFSFMAGLFKGKSDFNKGLAALALAAIPAYVGGVFAPVPWIGWLLALALSILSLVFLYRIIPAYLEVPDDKRALHYAVSLVSSCVAMLVIGAVLGIGAFTSRGFEHMAEHDTATRSGQHGVLGEIGRQAELMEKAEQSVYEPPTNGKISERQMRTYLDVMRKTAEYRSRTEAKIKQMQQDMEGKDEPGLSDIGKLASGFGAAFRSAATAEMEVVQSGGGNWAEHQWIKEQLRIAAIQQDLNEAVKHNYALYQKYAEQLSQYGEIY